MTYIPCSKRTFTLQLANPFVRNHKVYAYFLKFLLQRLGYDATIALWQNALKDYDDTFLQKILSAGWTRTEDAKTESIEKEVTSAFEEHFKSPVEGVSAEQARNLIERTPPIPQIREIFPTQNVVRSTTTYEAVHIAYDALAILVESLLDSYGKEGELITYDFLSAYRVSIVQGKSVSIRQFAKECIAFIKSPEPNIFTAGQDVEIVKTSDTEFVLHVKKCEWARYCQERHPQVGYLMACSTDEVFARACNEKIRMQRTSTLMKGGEVCDFRYYLTE